MSILLVRHGETAGNAERVLQLPDTPLNARGIRQAELLAERLAGFSAARLVCSDLLRARMTAEPITRRTGLVPELSPLLQERNFGELRGTAYGDVSPHLFSADYVPPGGESNEAFFERVARAFEHVLQLSARTDGPLIVVSHGLLCGALLARHASLGAGQTIDRVSNCSLTIVEVTPPHAITLLNCVQHLAHEPDLLGHVAHGRV
jgi:broad specificity phosphatase PhoE